MFEFSNEGKCFLCFDYFGSTSELSTLFQSLVICNAGLSTGLDVTQLLVEAKNHGNVANIVMIPGKSYSFLECVTEEDAESIYKGLNGLAKLAQNSCVLYLSYCTSGNESKASDTQLFSNNNELF